VNAPTAAPLAGEVDVSTDRLDLIFRTHYARINRVIGRVIQDEARAEELAVDVFLKWWRTSSAHGDGAEGWLVRTAARQALDELRRRTRRQRLDPLWHLLRRSPATPDEVFDTQRDQTRTRVVLAALRRRHAALLILRSDGLSYQELAAAMHLTPSYVGSLLARAQKAFRQEYERRYGRIHTR
jgi:RNA polymerase sigma-70 factor (ECF subfamily)